MTIADYIDSNSTQILSEWKRMAESEGFPSADPSQLALVNDLPDILRCVAASLRVRSDAVPQANLERPRKEFSLRRPPLAQHTLKQILQEYHWLRICVFAACERLESFAWSERKIILECFDRAVTEAAEEFAERRISGEESARKQAESERDESMAQVRGLKAEAGRREDFVASLSHDLRNPIAVAKMALELLLAEPEAEGADKFSELINRSLDRAESLIRTLLDVSLIKGGNKLRLQIQQCDLGALAEEAADELGPEFRDRIHFEFATPCTGEWDGDGLRRLMGNLLTNALKYGAADSPVTVRLNQSASTATIEVHNHGRPIAAEDQTAIFEPYRRATRGGDGDASSWGLGLAFVKGMAEAHGGKIEVESIDQVGTTFKVMLPNQAQTL